MSQQPEREGSRRGPLDSGARLSNPPGWPQKFRRPGVGESSDGFSILNDQSAKKGRSRVAYAKLGGQQFLGKVVIPINISAEGESVSVRPFLMSARKIRGLIWRTLKCSRCRIPQIAVFRHGQVGLAPREVLHPANRACLGHLPRPAILPRGNRQTFRKFSRPFALLGRGQCVRRPRWIPSERASVRR